MDKFKVGDRVINISDKTVPIGEIGTVMFTNKGELIGVEWDSFNNGNFDREYQRTKAKYKKEYAEDCKCQKCGKSFATPELARECEKTHEERRKAKREKYLMRKAAIKRAKEMEIEQMAKDMLKEKK